MTTNTQTEPSTSVSDPKLFVIPRGSIAKPFSTMAFALLSGDWTTVDAALSDDVEWDMMPNAQTLKGKSAVLAFLKAAFYAARSQPSAAHRRARMCSLSNLVGIVSLMGVAACASGEKTQPNAPSWTPSNYVPYGSTMSQETNMRDGQSTPAEQFVRAFDAAWSQNDVEGAIALFAEDATLETPLIQRLLHRKEGVLYGRDEIREMVRALMSGGKGWGGHEPPLIRGNTIAIEFQRPSSEDHYSVDIIELKDGKIQSLRAYLGWRSLTAPTSDAGLAPPRVSR